MFTTVSSTNVIEVNVVGVGGDSVAPTTPNKARATGEKKQPGQLKHYNAKRGRFEIPILELLEELGVPQLQTEHMSSRGLCPACGDKVETIEGKVTLCDKDFAVFQSLTRFGDAKRLGERIERMTPKDMGRLVAGEISLCPPREFVESTTDKTLEQAGTETIHGYCPICESPHERNTRGLKVGADGLNRKVLFCPDCQDIYTRRNKFAKAIALLVARAA